jgi:hypothetical protein
MFDLLYWTAAGVLLGVCPVHRTDCCCTFCATRVAHHSTTKTHACLLCTVAGGVLRYSLSSSVGVLQGKGGSRGLAMTGLLVLSIMVWPEAPPCLGFWQLAVTEQLSRLHSGLGTGGGQGTDTLCVTYDIGMFVTA